MHDWMIHTPWVYAFVAGYAMLMVQLQSSLEICQVQMQEMRELYVDAAQGAREGSDQGRNA